MPVQVRIPAALADLTAGERSASAEAGTVAGLLAALDSRYPGLQARLLDASGLRRYVSICVNGHDIRYGDSLDTSLRDGDAVWILPTSSGGMAASHGMWGR